MTARLILPGLLLASLLSACTTTTTKVPLTADVAMDSPADRWRRIATAADQSKIDRLGLAWQQGLSQARPRFAAEVGAEGALLEPLAGLARPAPTPGSYNCRMVRLGSSDRKSPAFERFKPFFCYVEVEGDLLTIVKQTGSQRPAGRLWEDDGKRLVFLGSLALGDSQQPLAYGDDPARDMAGVFERIAPFRWRLVIPYPQGPSTLDVFELVPVAEQPQ